MPLSEAVFSQIAKDSLSLMGFSNYLGCGKETLHLPVFEQLQKSKALAKDIDDKLKTLRLRDVKSC